VSAAPWQARLSRQLFALSRVSPVHALVRWAFAHASGVLPVRRIAENDQALAFHHPRPCWPTHALIVPKRSISSLMHLGTKNRGSVTAVFRLAAQVVNTLDLRQGGYMLLVNGGAYQDVGQLHFHLLQGGDEHSYDCALDDLIGRRLDLNLVDAFLHPRPHWAFHVVIRPRIPVADLPTLLNEQPDTLHEVILAARQIVDEAKLLAPGFALLTTYTARQEDRPLCFHLVSGASLA
jgi:histidine triad (HIT) family protein